MKDLFLEVVGLSLSGSIFVAAVMLLRLLFRKAPRWVFCLLWALAALRLVLPFRIETEASLMPPAIAEDRVVDSAMSGFVEDTRVFYEGSAGFHAAVDEGRKPVFSPEGSYVVTQAGSYGEPATLGDILAPVWLGGVALMVGYTALSWYLLRRRVATAVRREENIWESEAVASPFVLGLFRPRIYLPFGLEEQDRAHVIAHEKAHLRRGDHWWKPLGFLILSVYWFNPVIWAAYVLLCRDIEGACDEKVIASMTRDQLRAYSRALLRCSVHRKGIAACPVAFGEVGTKQRIARVMHYKKPAFRIVLTAVAASAAAAVLLLTSPLAEEPVETTAPVETTEATQPTETEPSGDKTYWDTPLFGEERVFYEVLEDSGNGTCSYRFFREEKDGRERELLTVEDVARMFSGDADGDGVMELFVQQRKGVSSNRLYDLVDGQILFTEPELVPERMRSWSVLLDSECLYLYKERWIDFFRFPQAYIRELASRGADRFIWASPSGVIPEEISEQQFREGYLEVQDFLDGQISEDQRRVAFLMLLELDQNCSPDAAVSLSGPDPWNRLLDKTNYTRENSTQWQTCLAQIGVLFDRDPGALLQAMAARKENRDPVIGWLVSSRYYYSPRDIAENLKQMEKSAVTDGEKALLERFRTCFEAMEPPVMDAGTLLSGTGEELWNAFIWDTEGVVRCFGKAEQTDRYRMTNLLWGTPGRPEPKSLFKCYDAVNRVLKKDLTAEEKDAAYRFLVLLEFQGAFRDTYVPGEAFDWQRFFDKHTYTDGATAEYWAIQCEEIFRQAPQEFLYALRAWEGTQEQKDRALMTLAYCFDGVDEGWFEETLKSLQGFSGDSTILEMLNRLEEFDS